MKKLGINENLQAKLLAHLDNLIAEADLLYRGFSTKEKREGVLRVVNDIVLRQIDDIHTTDEDLSQSDLDEMYYEVISFLHLEIDKRLTQTAESELHAQDSAQRQEIQGEISELLEAAKEINPDNLLSIDEVREWLFEYVKSHEREIQEFPEEEGVDHWNFLLADYDSRRPALFVFVLFTTDKVVLATGLGKGQAVRDFGEGDFPEEPCEVLPELANRFKVVAGPLEVDPEDLNKWIGVA